MTRVLYYGDNLEVLRKYIGDETVDLIYLDPPFNSNRDYNLLFREQSGEPAQAQIKAFTDTWQWSERAFQTFKLECPNPRLVELVDGFVRTLGRNDLTAYLVMMAPRLIELHRVLKPTGSLYLHCDPTASHYLKVMLDVIFGARNFRNEIAWCYTGGGRSQRYFGKKHDIIFFYSKSDEYIFNRDAVRIPYGIDVSKRKSLWAWGKHKGVEKAYAPHPEGKIPEDWWTIPPVNSQAKERLGYPTQKPLALLERIIQASSNEGDLVLDPFCGCGTAIVAAEKLRRQWIGIDITHLAIALIKYRLSDMFGLQERKDYQVIGEPTTEAEARALAQQDRDEFQKWAIGLVPRARPYQQKKGADTGIDGVLYFQDDPRDAKKALIQVKSGKVSVKDIREFAQVVKREGATLGLFLTLEPPTEPMIREAEQEGFYTTPLGNRLLPRLQIRTVAQLLSGEGFLIPSTALLMGVQQAERVAPNAGQQQIPLE
ncbi:MAG: DNA methyltransferase [Fimbriimonadales bacterium]|nr:DNA methyltransferase [Fimbriimonadales bacterium]